MYAKCKYEHLHTIFIDGDENNKLIIRKEQLRSRKEDFYAVYWERPNAKDGEDPIISSLGSDYTEAGAFVIVASFFAQRLKSLTPNTTQACGHYIEHNAIMYASRVLGIPTA